MGASVQPVGKSKKEGGSNQLTDLRKAVAAGVVIGVGSTVFLVCENPIMGAFLFSIGLFAVCALKLNLFTGKVGYIVKNRNKPNCLLIWFGNLIGGALTVLPMRLAKPELSETAFVLSESKLSQNVGVTIILGIACGILMYIAVENYAQNKSEIGKQIGIFLSVTVFILCGFEHSIANICYFLFCINSVDQIVPVLFHLFIVSVSNAAGSLFFWLLSKEKAADKSWEVG